MPRANQIPQVTEDQQREEVLRLALDAANLPHGSEPIRVASALRKYASNQAFDAVMPGGGESHWQRSELADAMADELEAKIAGRLLDVREKAVA